MELRQLKYFLAVADARSFANAATTLYVSRQAVSKSIAQLEAEMGVELFVRDSGGAFLTPAGLMFYDQVRSNVIELEQTRSHMLRYGKRYQQRIRMAFPVGTVSLYEETLLTFMREQNNLSLEYSEHPEEQCLDLLRERKVNLVFLTVKPQDPDLEVTMLTTSSYGVLLQNTENLRSTDTLRFEDLSWLPIAAVTDACTQSLCKEKRLPLRYTGLDLYRLFALTLQGQCAMVLPQCQAPVGMPGLRWIPLEQAEPWTLYCVCLKSMENSTLYRTAIDELQSRVFEPGPQLPGERSSV